MTYPVSPALDTLIAEIDRQMVNCPHAFSAPDDGSFFSETLGVFKRRGHPYIRFFLNGIEFALPLTNALQIG
jgi:hypothetical protein